MFQSDIFDKMTLHAKKSLAEAGVLASYYQNAEIEPLHLLYAVYLEKGSLGSNILRDMGIKKSCFDSILPAKTKKDLAKNNPVLGPSPILQKLITRAYSLASSFSYPYVGTEHLIYALLESDDEKILKLLEKTSGRKIGLEALSRSPLDGDFFSELSNHLPFPDVKLSKGRRAGADELSYLKQFCINLNEEAEKRNEIVSGRETEIERIIHILGRKSKNNPLLIGDPGVGKTALISGLARKINEGNVPAFLADKIIFSLDMTSVVAGTTFRGEFENRLKEIISEATRNKNVILFIDEIHIIVGAGNSQGGLDAANILKPALSKGDIQCIGATTYSEYKKYIEKDPALARRFQPMQLLEPSIKDAKAILKKIKKQYEKFHHVSISPDAIDGAVELSVRYISDRFLPDKALDLLDETASAVKNKLIPLEKIQGTRKLEKERKRISNEKEKFIQEQRYEEAMKLQKKEALLEKEISRLKKDRLENEGAPYPLTIDDVIATVSKITGIPKERMSTKQERSAVNDLEKRLNESIIGQEKALRTISEVLLRSHSGISDPNRPMGSFLFLGPSGVGKTLTAKMIAKQVFSSENSIVKIDMSEFSEKHTVARLVGAPAGYVGFGEGGGLTEKVRHKPYSLVLFDEIEKAHPDVLNILLQILEDGMLTDAEGRQVNFKNTVIILTSNIGTSEFTDSAKMGFSEKGGERKMQEKFSHIGADAMKKLSEKMKPEILNRLDHIIIFEALLEKDIAKIVSTEIKSLAKRLKNQGLTLRYSRAVENFITKKSNLAEYGGRLVRKNIQDLLETEIARFILANPPRKSISLALKDGKIIAK